MNLCRNMFFSCKLEISSSVNVTAPCLKLFKCLRQHIHFVRDTPNATQAHVVNALLADRWIVLVHDLLWTRGTGPKHHELCVDAIQSITSEMPGVLKESTGHAWHNVECLVLALELRKCLGSPRSSPSCSQLLPQPWAGIKSAFQLAGCLSQACA